MACIVMVACVFMYGILKSLKYQPKKRFTFLIVVKCLATLGCACTICYGIVKYFENAVYDMAENAIIAGIGACFALVLLL